LLPTMNLCTAVLPTWSFEEVVQIAGAAGYQGIELRVDAEYHKSLEDVQREGTHILRVLEPAGLGLPILSSYISLEDQRSVDILLSCCQSMGIPKARLVLPRSSQVGVMRHAQDRVIMPAYDARQEPHALLASVRKTLRRLECQARAAGVQLLLELHWGTVMSSFSSAYLLIHDLDPESIAITFDPANMLVEGKEDWEFGIKLIQPHLANVHVKNVRWSASRTGWVWMWAPLAQGMVDWPDLIALLKRNHYAGDYAIEDFLVSNMSKPTTIDHLTTVRSHFCRLYEHTGMDGFTTWPGAPKTPVTTVVEATPVFDADTTLEGHHVEIRYIR
jgi:sugar phosphate isomerase/epimerase